MAKIPIPEKVKCLLQSTRPANLLMVCAGVIITIFIGVRAFPPAVLAPAVIAAVLIAAGGNSINDYYDIDIDRVNKPGRPLPSGKLRPNELWAFAVLLFAVGVGTSFALPVYCTIIAIVNSVLLGLYAAKLKRSGFFGNILISYLVASVFIFSALAVGEFFLGIFLSMVAFFTNASREVLKDLEDVKGDRIFGAKTFPMLEGRKKAVVVVDSFLVLAILISPLPYLLGILSLYYMLFALVADLLFVYVIYSISQDAAQKSIEKNQKRVKIAAVIGLLAFLAGTVGF